MRKSLKADSGDQSTVKEFSVIDSDGLDHYRAQPGNWNVQVSQLAWGAFRSHIRSIRLPGLVVYDNRWGAPCLIRGESPAEWLVIGGNVTPDVSPIRWCGKQADRRNWACSAEGRAIDFSTEQQAHDVVLLITPDLLNKTAGAEAVATVRKSQHVHFGDAGSEIVDLILDILARCESRSSLLESPVATNDIRSQILLGLEKCFATVLPRESACSLSVREEAVHRAITHVAGARKPVSAWDMAQVAGVSQKTLESAFKESLGMTPGRYLKVNRLNRAHHQLAKTSSTDTTITYVALAHGFCHMGRFSNDYRKLFGELPSQTLERRAS